tara:strand:+ start:4209 stop:4475 length:267 start_codon:yes stop_codon:yes gene_type:complete
LDRSDVIRTKLDKALGPTEIKVIDESSLHDGHAGSNGAGQSHYRVEVRSSVFIGKSKVERERIIHSLLLEEYSSGLHALSIRARAPED